MLSLFVNEDELEAELLAAIANHPRLLAIALESRERLERAKAMRDFYPEPSEEFTLSRLAELGFAEAGSIDADLPFDATQLKQGERLRDAAGRP